MDLLLDTDAAVAAKDRLHRCLYRIVPHKEALPKHLAAKWRDLFGATFGVLLYDLTSTCFEGEAPEVSPAKRGYSRDHRPDCLQVVLALVVTPEGFPLTYEVFPGNTLDRASLATILDSVEQKHGKARRMWVFDRGIVSEDTWRSCAHYLVGTPKRKLQAYEQKPLDVPWTKTSAEVEVQLVPEDDEVYVLCRSAARQAKERAMRWRWPRGLIGGLRALRRRVAQGQLKNPDLIQQQIGRLNERHPQPWRWVTVEYVASSAGETLGAITWTWPVPRSLALRGPKARICCARMGRRKIRRNCGRRMCS